MTLQPKRIPTEPSEPSYLSADSTRRYCDWNFVA